MVIPYIIVAPYFFLAKITLGQMTQTAGAFGRVDTAQLLYRALPVAGVVQGGLRTADDISLGDRDGSWAWQKIPRIERTEHLGRDLVLRDLTLCLPEGRLIVSVSGRR